MTHFYERVKSLFFVFIRNPLKYSLSGISFALNDRAFRLELILGIIFFPIIVGFIIKSAIWQAILFCLYVQILIVELINSALERTVDYISIERHPLAKQIKDIASAAVFLTICEFFIVFFLAVMYFVC